MDFNKKGNREFFNDKLLFKTVGIMLLIGIVVLIIADIKIYQKKRELASQIKIYQEKIEEIKKNIGSLLSPKEVFLFEQIPTTAIGKPDRRAAKNLAIKIMGGN